MSSTVGDGSWRMETPGRRGSRLCPSRWRKIQSENHPSPLFIHLHIFQSEPADDPTVDSCEGWWILISREGYNYHPAVGSVKEGRGDRRSSRHVRFTSSCSHSAASSLLSITAQIMRCWEKSAKTPGFQNSFLGSALIFFLSAARIYKSARFWPDHSLDFWRQVWEKNPIYLFFPILFRKFFMISFLESIRLAFGFVDFLFLNPSFKF